MLFMTILTWEPDKRNEAVTRRTQFKYPEGMKRIGEWNDLAGGRVFILSEAEDPKAVLAATFAWDDLGKFEITPVMETDELMKLMPKT